MYNEDPFDNDDADFEDIPELIDTYSVSSYQSTVNSKKKNLHLQQSEDKGFRKIKNVINGRKVEFEVYSTNTTPGIKIRDAITGAKDSRYKVGSADEYLFFKVKMTSGHIDFKNKDASTTLFFVNPEQFERHMHTSLSQEIKEIWYKKYLKQLAKYQ